MLIQHSLLRSEILTGPYLIQLPYSLILTILAENQNLLLRLILLFCGF